MWSIRMRAGARPEGSKPQGKDESKLVHISGAECMAAQKDIQATIKKYTNRALSHPRGRPDQIVITVQRLSEKPKPVKALPLVTLNSPSAQKAWEYAIKILCAAGVSARAVAAAQKIIMQGGMSGAAILSAKGGRRLDPDKKGVRVSMLGIDPHTLQALSRGLTRLHINTDTVKEALMLASKAASCPGILAELCVSDDPHYQTGYAASGKLGYVRIPNLKARGKMWGGRVFFVSKDFNLDTAIKYLKHTPIMIKGLGPLQGERALDEVISAADS